MACIREYTSGTCMFWKHPLAKKIKITRDYDFVKTTLKHTCISRQATYRANTRALITFIHAESCAFSCGESWKKKTREKKKFVLGKKEKLETTQRLVIVFCLRQLPV
jgi:hypothetical protein